MKISRTATLLPLLVCCALSLALHARAASAAARPAGDDIRDIFLSMPYPSNVERGTAAGSYVLLNDEDFKRHFATAEARRNLLTHTDFGKHGNVLDTEGGYIVAGFDHQGNDEAGGGDPPYFILATYFNTAGGSRLVVLQFGDRSTPDGVPGTEDYFFTLEGGRYRQERAERFLPRLDFFADCWGSQPLPRPKLRGEMNGGIAVEWPRKGTTAREVCYTPYIDIDPDNLEGVFEKRQFDSVALIWDRQRGVFVKGEKSRHAAAR